MSETNDARLAQLADLGVRSASLVHELRQPLFALKGELQLALQRAGRLEPEQVRELLAHVGDLEELLEHYGAQERWAEPRLRFDLNEPVRRAVDLMAAHERRVGARVDLRLAEQQLLVQGRPGAARQVMINLLHNAYDAVEGRPDAAVVISSRAIGEVVQVVVQDTGPGIPDALRPRLFEPFVTTKAAGRGTGLGLYIARQLVVEAAGQLRLISPDGGGTRVELELPLAVI